MSCFDYLMGECPHCNKEVDSQTKLFGCEMRSIKKGDAVDDMDHVQVDILCKNPCLHCGGQLVARFRSNVFEGFVLSKATYQELLFGAIEEIKDDNSAGT